MYKDPENILFDGLKLLGCGLSDIKDNFSTTEMSACAIRANNGSATFNNLVIANAVSYTHLTLPTILSV